MAGSALAGRATIGHYISAVDLTLLVVTEAARHLLVRSGERKRAGFFVVEQRSSPLNRVMAGRAVHRLGPFLELPRVNVLVATHAFFRRPLERSPFRPLR